LPDDYKSIRVNELLKLAKQALEKLLKATQDIFI